MATMYVLMAAPCTLPAALERELRRHCERQYPEEACGALLGTGDGATEPWVVLEVLPAPNAEGADPRRRYLVPPEAQLDAERRAHASGRLVLGWYHSHPDHPARPSEHDRASAWPGYLYLVCAVRQGRAAELGAFVLTGSGGPFVEVELRGAPGAPTRAGDAQGSRDP